MLGDGGMEAGGGWVLDLVFVFRFVEESCGDDSKRLKGKGC